MTLFCYLFSLNHLHYYTLCCQLHLLHTVLAATFVTHCIASFICIHCAASYICCILCCQLHLLHTVLPASFVHTVMPATFCTHFVASYICSTFCCQLHLLHTVLPTTFGTFCVASYILLLHTVLNFCSLLNFLHTVLQITFVTPVMPQHLLHICLPVTLAETLHRIIMANARVKLHLFSLIKTFAFSAVHVTVNSTPQ